MKSSIEETYLRCYAGDQPRQWAKYLPWAEWAYNTSFHSAIHTTPFEAVYGWAPPTIPSYVNPANGTATRPEIHIGVKDDEIRGELSTSIGNVMHDRAIYIRRIGTRYFSGGRSNDATRGAKRHLVQRRARNLKRRAASHAGADATEGRKARWSGSKGRSWDARISSTCLTHVAIICRSATMACPKDTKKRGSETARRITSHFSEISSILRVAATTYSGAGEREKGFFDGWFRRYDSSGHQGAPENQLGTKRYAGDKLKREERSRRNRERRLCTV